MADVYGSQFTLTRGSPVSYTGIRRSFFENDKIAQRILFYKACKSPS